MVPGRLGLRRARWPLLGLGGIALIAAVIVVVAGIGQATGGRACAAVVSGTGASGVSAGMSAGGAQAEADAERARAASVSGTATHYVLSGTGNCSYPAAPADGLFVALSPAEYDNGAACGSYIEVSGPDGSVRAEVIDQCPPCAAGHIDLSEGAFSRIAPLAAGLVNVSYQTLTDPALAGPISMRVKEGSSQYWLALLAINTGNALASVQVQTASGSWLSLSRVSYNYWIAASGAGSGPFTVRLTDTAGHQVTVHDIALEPGAVQDTGVSMYGGGVAAAPEQTAPATRPATAPASRAARRPRAPATSATKKPAASAAAPQLLGQAVVTLPHSPSPSPSC
jgi:expansin (peptidoglycan-binding protein)